MDNTQIPIQKMEIAARNIDKSLIIDTTAPTLIELMNINPQALSTVSGLTDHDYPVLSGMHVALNNMTQIKTVNKVPLPTEIMEHFGHVQCHCMMGLFPEINRAWLTVDSDIYVWTYEENLDLAYFDGLSETILCVGLIKPKSGVFHEFIKYLLVLVTAVDIVVLGVTFSKSAGGNSDEIQLIPDPIFTLPTDGTTFSTVVGTSLGRLFLGSKEGCIYEITYQAASGWFGKRCKKINHSTNTLSYFVPSFINAALSEEDGIVQIVIDNSRHILYTLSEKGSIEVCDLGEKGTSFNRIAKLSQSSLVNQAINTVKTLDSQNFKPIISISPVEISESSSIYLVATTQTGVRFYLSTHSLYNVPPNQRPYTLNIVHVRLPPGYSANLTVRPRAGHMSIYKDRNLILLSTVNDKDVLWCISSDLFPFSHNLMEAYTTVNLDGPALAIAEVPQDNPLDNIIMESTPLVMRQHYELPKKIVVLTSQCIHIFTKFRPVDVLKQLLKDSHGLDSEAVKAFYLIQKEDQACATSLIIASNDAEDDAEVADYATRAFFMFGGEPRLTQVNPAHQSNPFSSTFSPNIISTPAPHYQQLQASYSQNMSAQSAYDCNYPFVFSSKHNGWFLKTMPKRLTKYIQDWENNPDFQSWLVRDPNKNEHCAFCKLCKKSFRIDGSGVAQVKSHANSSKHLNIMRLCNNNTNQMQFQRDDHGVVSLGSRHGFILNDSEKIAKAEILWALKCVFNNFSFASNEGCNKLFREMFPDSVVAKNISTLTTENCKCFLNNLRALYNFLLRNTQFSSTDFTSTQQFQTANQTINTSLNITRLNHTIQDAQNEEKQSLNSLKLFVSHCNQILGLWKILCEHQFHILIGSLPESQQHILQNTTFKDLFLYGQDICSVLIITLIESYLTDNASVDSISAKLREVCPDLYRIEDAAFSKANEMLKSSKVIMNVDEKEEMLASALELCKSIAPNINLHEMCNQFILLKAYQAVIDLSLTCAKKVDPDKIADHFYKNDSVADVEGRNFYQKRMNIYKEIFNMLDVLYSENENTSSQPDLIMNSEANLLINKIIQDILDYPDELLHVALYDWIISKQLISILIKVEKPSLETYLIRTTQRNPDKIEVMDLLWKYYESNENYTSAAKILDNLASKTGNLLPLKTRTEHLTRAIMCMRSDKIGYAPYLGVFLRDLEDKMAVAKVQEQILDAVECLKGVHPDAEQAIIALNSGLYQISQLYENFAEPLELWECQLAIINCAGYVDEKLVENIWRNILKKEIRSSAGAPDNRMAQILVKVKQIAKQCGTTNHCFPLEFLVSEIEQISSYLKCDKTLVPRVFILMEAPLDKLISIYTKLILSITQFSIWQKEENQFHLFESVAALIELFLNSHETIGSLQKRKIIAECQDSVASFLSLLYSKPNTDELISRLRSLQTRLSRL